MNIKLLSDLHLEFNNPIKPGEGDVLCLAGDITTHIDVDKHSDWFKEAADNYNKVFYIMGNHEYYDGDINTTCNYIRERIDSRIVVLDDNSQVYRGVHFVGTTLWTDYNNEDHDVMSQCERVMNDYQYVTDGDDVPLSARALLYRHENARRWLRMALPTLRGPVVVMSHHAPCYGSVVAPGYGSRMPHAYASDLTHEIIRHDHLKYWFHGHAHRNNDYKIGSCRVLSNPCGYHPDGLNKEFNSELSVPVDEVAQEGLCGEPSYAIL